ncbi:MAG: hypothetical protein EP302_03310 [Bacteroidetes bacterium]|jgi:hypothetical protein|nr:MAG: hypothetical protein EP302_03310 [Bacteroidota bacterium]UCE69487.1 MAG: hypothetical protein JSW57_00775 [Flavobacteriaceae bacterium]
MSKISVFLIVFLVFSGCNSRVEETSETSESVTGTDVQEFPEVARIDAGAREILDAWAEYRSLEDRMAVLREAENEEEMKLLLEELNQICTQLEESTFPVTFEQPSVQSRLKVIRTYLGKLEAALYYRLDHDEPLRELMESYNALREQFNVIVRNTLSPDLFEDE